MSASRAYIGQCETRYRTGSEHRPRRCGRCQRPRDRPKGDFIDRPAAISYLSGMMRIVFLILLAAMGAALAQETPVTAAAAGNLPPGLSRSPCVKPDAQNIGRQPGDRRDGRAVAAFNDQVRAYNKVAQTYNACVQDYAARRSTISRKSAPPSPPPTPTDGAPMWTLQVRLAPGAL